jgi:hypothetical protein
LWTFEHPLNQFDIPYEIVSKLDKAPKNMSIDTMRDMDAREIGALIRFQKEGFRIRKFVHQFPTLHLEAQVAPITRTVLRVVLHITADFEWNDAIHSGSEPWHIWVQDAENEEIIYSQYYILSKRQYLETQTIRFTIPIPQNASTSDGAPPQIFIKAVSDKWIGAETTIAVSFKHLILPTMYRTPHTKLLNLAPLSVRALKNPVLEDICRQKFDYFNPVQTQIFHVLYHTQYNVHYLMYFHSVLSLLDNFLNLYFY